MPSSRPLCNKVVVPNADIRLPVAAAFALKPGEGRAWAAELQVSSSTTR